MAKENKIDEEFMAQSNQIRVKNYKSEAIEMAKDLEKQKVEKVEKADVVVSGQVSSKKFSGGGKGCNCGCENGRSKREREIIVEDKEERRVTLYDSLNKRRKIMKIIGILLLVGDFFLYSWRGGNSTVRIVLIVSLIVAIVLLIVSHGKKQDLESICPCCKNAFGEEVERELIDENGYVTATENFGKITFDKQVVSRKYRIAMECPECGNEWFVDETV